LLQSSRLFFACGCGLAWMVAEFVVQGESEGMEQAHSGETQGQYQVKSITFESELLHKD
jgi:hypothetical protein